MRTISLIILFLIGVFSQDTLAQNQSGHRVRSTIVVDDIEYEIFTTEKFNLRMQNRSSFTRLNDCGRRVDGKSIGEYELYGVVKEGEQTRPAIIAAFKEAFTIAGLRELVKNLIHIFMIIEPNGRVVETGYIYNIDSGITFEHIAKLDEGILEKVVYDVSEKMKDYYYVEESLTVGLEYVLNAVDIPIVEIDSPAPSLGSGSGPLRP